MTFYGQKGYEQSRGKSNLSSIHANKSLHRRKLYRRNYCLTKKKKKKRRKRRVRSNCKAIPRRRPKVHMLTTWRTQIPHPVTKTEVCWTLSRERMLPYANVEVGKDAIKLQGTTFTRRLTLCARLTFMFHTWQLRWSSFQVLMSSASRKYRLWSTYGIRSGKFMISTLC